MRLLLITLMACHAPNGTDTGEKMLSDADTDSDADADTDADSDADTDTGTTTDRTSTWPAGEFLVFGIDGVDYDVDPSAFWVVDDDRDWIDVTFSADILLDGFDLRVKGNGELAETSSDTFILAGVDGTFMLTWTNNYSGASTDDDGDCVLWSQHTEFGSVMSSWVESEAWGPGTQDRLWEHTGELAIDLNAPCMLSDFDGAALDHLQGRANVWTLTILP